MQGNPLFHNDFIGPFGLLYICLFQVYLLKVNFIVEIEELIQSIFLFKIIEFYEDI